ncbi:hypothetical protein HYALB_00008305 [Hymenoscyphus albidus]|uniref:TPR-like protein n=1 Tax=Hymenoscyphus albidus TaxID=595503 RepID=A0A9N9LB77_9HELO|nr:hypothetical protein HYALB_00008305 [Hymenoscyphus albidus]
MSEPQPPPSPPPRENDQNPDAGNMNRDITASTKGSIGDESGNRRPSTDTTVSYTSTNTYFGTQRQPSLPRAQIPPQHPAVPQYYNQFGNQFGTPSPSPAVAQYQAALQYQNQYGDQFGTYKKSSAASQSRSSQISRVYGYAGGSGQSSVGNSWDNHTYSASYRRESASAMSLSEPNHRESAQGGWSSSTPGRLGQFEIPVTSADAKQEAATEQSDGNQAEPIRYGETPDPRASDIDPPAESYPEQTRPNVSNFNQDHHHAPQYTHQPKSLPQEGSVASFSYYPRSVPSLAAARSKAVSDLLSTEDFVIRLPRSTLNSISNRFEPSTDLADEDFVRRVSEKIPVPAISGSEPAPDLLSEDFVRRVPENIPPSAATRNEPVTDVPSENFAAQVPSTQPGIDPILDLAIALATSRAEIEIDKSVSKARSRENSVEEPPKIYSDTPSVHSDPTIALANSRAEFETSTSEARARSREGTAEEPSRSHSAMLSNPAKGAFSQSKYFSPARSREPAKEIAQHHSGSPPAREREKGGLSYNSSDEDTDVETELEGHQEDDDVSDAESEYGEFDEKMRKMGSNFAQLQEEVGDGLAPDIDLEERAESDEESNHEEAEDETSDSGSEPIVEPKALKPRRKVHRGPRKAAEPTGEIKMRLGIANDLIFAQRFEEAMEVLDEIIVINAETASAWTKKAAILKEWGQLENAIKSLLYAAHLRYKHLEAWFHCVDFIEDHAGDHRPEFLYLLHICYSRALRADITSVRAQFGKADLFYEEKKYKQALPRYTKILQKFSPHNTSALRKIADCAIEMGKYGAAIKAYEEEIAYFRSEPEDSEFFFDWDDAMTYADLLSFGEDHERALKELKSLSRWLLGRGAETYWDNVTEDDAEWDDDDDRRTYTHNYVPGKYDENCYGLGLPLGVRISLGIYRLRLGPRHRDEALYHFDFLNLSNEFEEEIQPANQFYARKVGDLFLELNDHQNALKYYEYLVSISEEQNAADLRMDMGKCYYELERYEEAINCFQIVADLDKNDENPRQYLAAIYAKSGQEELAFNMTSQARAIMMRKAPQRTRRNNKKKNEPKEPRKYKQKKVRIFRKILYNLQPKPANGEIPSIDPVTDANGDVINPRQRQRQQHPQQKHRGRRKDGFDNVFASAFADSMRLGAQYSILEKQTEGMRAGDIDSTEAWMNAAKQLTDEFRAMRAFYPLDKTLKFAGYYHLNERVRGNMPLHADLTEIHKIEKRLAQKMKIDVADRANLIPANLPQDFKGRSFDQWLDIFMEYAICFAKQDKQRDSYEICTAMKDCVVWYHSSTSIFLVHLCWSVCAVLLGDEDTVINMTRWFMKEFQFTTDAYRIFAIFSRLVQSPVIFYNESASQKFLLRQIRAMDYNLVSEKEKKKRHWENRAYFHSKDENGNVIRNHDLDTSLLMTFGYVLSTSGSQVIALGYIMRAHALDPDNPMINLAIGLAYIHHNLKRQSENRQHGFMQGLTFIRRYYEHRKISDCLEERLEAHYNMGRTYHLLGLTHLALPYYWKVLNEEVEKCKEVGDGEREESGDGWKGEKGQEELYKEVAYAVKTIYEAAGNMELARSVVREFLTL